MTMTMTVHGLITRLVACVICLPDVILVELKIYQDWSVNAHSVTISSLS